MTVTSLSSSVTISRETPLKVEPKFKKPEIVDPAKVEGIMTPSFPPKSEEDSRMQTRLGAPRP